MAAAARTDPRLTERIGLALARYLSGRRPAPAIAAKADIAALSAAVQPGDVPLVEGDTRFSVAIKYLTQSTWSHAALFVGDGAGLRDAAGRALTVVEADVIDGVRAVPLAAFAGQHVRICRPVGLRADEVDRLVQLALARLGHRYDLKHIVDLLRWLLPTPPVPTRWRRRMIAFGSSDPTRAICSTLIAQLFQAVHYPILPTIERQPTNVPDCNDCTEEILHVRHHSLFVPRDFDVSPYFAVVKPALAPGFDPHRLRWADPARPTEEAPA